MELLTMNRFEKAAAFGAMMGKKAFYKKAGNPTLDFYKKQQEQEIANARAQAAALRSAAGVSGPGGGTATGRVFPDGKGGYRTEGAQFTPQAGYDQKGFKTQPSGVQGTPAAKPRYSLRNDPAFKEDFEDIAEEKANMNKLQNATGNAGNGSYQGTIQGGKVKPGATFTPAAPTAPAVPAVPPVTAAPVNENPPPMTPFQKAFGRDKQKIEELKAKGRQVSNAAGANGASGTSEGTIERGKVQLGATFTPNGGQQGQRPLPGAGGKQKMPPAPMGQRQTPKAVPTNKTIPSNQWSIFDD